MKKSNFLKYDLPWIIAAVVVVILLFGKMFIDGDFSKITYDGRSFSLPTEGIMPTSDIIPTPEATFEPTPSAGEKVMLVLNTNSKKIHIIDCRYANSISEENRHVSPMCGGTCPTMKILEIEVGGSDGFPLLPATLSDQD